MIMSFGKFVNWNDTVTMFFHGKMMFEVYTILWVRSTDVILFIKISYTKAQESALCSFDMGIYTKRDQFWISIFFTIYMKQDTMKMSLHMKSDHIDGFMQDCSLALRDRYDDFTEYEWNVSLVYDTHTKAFIRASDFDFQHTNAHQSAVDVAQLCLQPFWTLVKVHLAHDCHYASKHRSQLPRSSP